MTTKRGFESVFRFAVAFKHTSGLTMTSSSETSPSSSIMSPPRQTALKGPTASNSCKNLVSLRLPWLKMAHRFRRRFAFAGPCFTAFGIFQVNDEESISYADEGFLDGRMGDSRLSRFLWASTNNNINNYNNSSWNNDKNFGEKIRTNNEDSLIDKFTTWLNVFRNKEASATEDSMPSPPQPSDPVADRVVTTFTYLVGGLCVAALSWEHCGDHVPDPVDDFFDNITDNNAELCWLVLVLLSALLVHKLRYPVSFWLRQLAWLLLALFTGLMFTGFPLIFPATAIVISVVVIGELSVSGWRAPEDYFLPYGRKMAWCWWGWLGYSVVSYVIQDQFDLPDILDKLCELLFYVVGFGINVFFVLHDNQLVARDANQDDYDPENYALRLYADCTSLIVLFTSLYIDVFMTVEEIVFLVLVRRLM